MGVLLSRKSEARSIITGNSVSSSNSCLEMMMVMLMLMLMLMLVMMVVVMVILTMMVLLMMVGMLPLTCRQWPSGRRFHMQLAKAS